MTDKPAAPHRAGHVRNGTAPPPTTTPPLDAGIDRVLLVPFQADPAAAAPAIVRLVAQALASMKPHSDGFIYFGEISGPEAKHVPPPFFPRDPVSIVAAGTPLFVNSMTSRFSKSVGAGLVIHDLDRVPSLPAIAAVSQDDVWIAEDGELAAYADKLAAGGWDVQLCDETTFGVCVEVPAQAWVEATSTMRSTRYSPPPKPRGMRRVVREPGEPQVGEDIVGIGVGQGIGTVVKVQRRAGGWTRVKIAYAAGCIPGPRYPGQPETEWEVPTGEMWLTREEVERLRTLRNEAAGRPASADYVPCPDPLNDGCERTHEATTLTSATLFVPESRDALHLSS